MLYQDALTGMLHEAPDVQLSGWGLAEDPYGLGEGQIVYDGLGNPVGWSPFRGLKSLIKKAVPFATSMMGPYGQIISRALPAVTRALAPTAQALRQQVQQDMGPPPEAQPQLEGLPVGYSYVRPGGYYPASVRPSWPASWRPPQVNAFQPRVYSQMPRPPVAWRPPQSPNAAFQPRPYSPMPVRQQWPAGWKRPQVPYTGPQPRRVYMRCAVWRGPGGLVPINPGQAPIVTPQAAAPMPTRRHRRHRR
jgi:hypothetical protein